MSQPERWITGQAEFVNAWLADAWSSQVQPASLIQICGALALPTTETPGVGWNPPGDAAEYVIMDEVYTSGCFHAYRITGIWVAALGGTVAPSPTCSSIGVGTLAVGAYGSTGPFGPAPSDGGVKLFHPPAALWPLAPLVGDVCADAGDTTIIQVPALYMGTCALPVPTGTDNAASPEFAVSVVDTGAAFDDFQGAAKAFTASGLPDWTLYGGPQFASSGSRFPAGRRTWP